LGTISIQDFQKLHRFSCSNDSQEDGFHTSPHFSRLLIICRHDGACQTLIEGPQIL
jgi:hypothetical protein